jgi:predicted nucleic acid-binding protein
LRFRPLSTMCIDTISFDSSVWIDLLLDKTMPQTTTVRRLLTNGDDLGIGDLMLPRVLRGTRTSRRFNATGTFLGRFDPIRIVDHRAAEIAARNYRTLRAKGITIRKTIDTLIATRCILDRLPLLYSDRDFDPFVQHLGLRSAMDHPTGVN